MFTGIRPEFHTDTGRMEAFIQTARNALSYDERPEDIHARLLKAGADADEAHHALVAAALLGRS